MALIDDLITAIRSKLVALEPQHEGLRDFSRLNILDATKKEIETSIGIFNRKVSQLETLLSALLALQDDGLDIPNRTVSAEVFADLLDQVRTIQAALGTFNNNEPTPAVILGLTSEPPEPK